MCGAAPRLQHGLPADASSVRCARAQSGLARVKSNLGSSVRKGKLTQDAADKVLARVRGTLDYSGFGDVDMVRRSSPLFQAFQPCPVQGWGTDAPAAIFGRNIGNPCG